MIARSWRPALFLLALAAAVFGFRYARLADLEPRIDQAHCMRWLQDVRRADHFWPRAEAGEGMRAALEGDRGSALNQVARRLFNQGIRAFNLVSLATLWAASLLLGDSYRAHNVMSILASCGVVVLAGLCPLWCRAPKERRSGPTARDLLWGFGAALACGASFYLHLFSPWGWHNIGAFYTLLAVASTTRILTVSTPATRTLAIVTPLVAVDALSVYSHYTVLFFLPSATAVALLASRVPWSLRLRRAASYLLAMGVVVLPGTAMVLLLAKENAAAYAVFPGGGLGYVAGVPALALGWFSSHARLYSAPGLVAGLVGLVWLGRRRGTWMPLAFVGGHFAAWSLLPGFSGTTESPTWLRTSIYVLPLLGVGAVFCAISSIERAVDVLRAGGTSTRFRLAEVGGAVLAASLVTAHLGIQIGCLLDFRWQAARIPEFSREYLEGQGSLRPMVGDIQRMLTVPQRSALLTWDSTLQDLFQCLAEPAGPHVEILPALDVMRDRAAEGALPAYLRRRRVQLEQGVEMTLLSGPGCGREDLRHIARSVLGPGGLEWSDSVDLLEMMQWDTGCPAYGRITLYHVERDSRRGARLTR